jgi:geranylgeranyl diphosphate synthase type II
MQRVHPNLPGEPVVSRADGADARGGLPAWCAAERVDFETALEAHLRSLAAAAAQHSRLCAAVEYSVKVGGKRLRPILVLGSCRLCGGEPAVALPAAIAMELVHTFSLIHDDLPAMDNDDLRRGQPTNHRVFGDGLAILAGDWLAAHALGLLTRCRVDGETVRRLVAALTHGIERMIAGQAADIAGEHQPADLPRVQYIHLHKTAALIETACRLGGLCGGGSEAQLAALSRFGQHLGLAFQIADDLLDETATTQQMGKRTHKDAAIEKQTYPAAVGARAARQEAERQVAAAIAALAPFGPAGQRLAGLAHYALGRDH